MATTQPPPITWYEAAPDRARPRHTADVSDLLDAATVHPGAALFNQRIRRRVANGPVFDQRLGGMFVRVADGMCVVGALSQDGPLSEEFTVEERCAFLDLIARNDRGHYADRANLRRDLLGEERVDPAPAYADEDTAFMAAIVGEVIARVLAEGYDPDAAPSDADEDTAPTTLQRAGFHAVDDTDAEYDAIDASTAWLVSIAEDAAPSDAVQRAAFAVEDAGRD